MRDFDVTEVTAFSDHYEEFAELDCEILGMSVDSQFCHLAWTQTDRKSGGVGDINFPLVSDLTKQISRDYDVLTEDGVALRGLFIIDKEGIVQHCTVNNLAFGRNVAEVKRTLQAIQYVQANPDEVCPAGWQPGDSTMKEDPEVTVPLPLFPPLDLMLGWASEWAQGSKEFFAAI